MVNASRRVLERFIEKEAMSDSEHAELKLRLSQFEKYVNQLAESEDDVKTHPDDYGVKVNTAANVRATFTFLKRMGSELLFLGLLKNYHVSRKDQRTLERAAKTFAKRQMNRIKADKAIEVYTKFLKELRLFLSAAQAAFHSGKIHGGDTGTTFKAGPFTLINTGGFSEKQMEDVVKVVEKAAQYLNKIGMSKLCYGDIQVTNTVGRSSKILAFYLINKDELYIRANLKGKQGPALHSVIHELAHRLHFKFLRGSNYEIQNIYDIIKDRDRQAEWEAREDPSKRPNPGDTVQEGRKTWVVEEVRPLRNGELGVIVYLEGKPEKKAGITMGNWFKVKKELAFVSPYAATQPQENFAEMVAHYALGTLPEDQVTLLKTVI